MAVNIDTDVNTPPAQAPSRVATWILRLIILYSAALAFYGIYAHRAVYSLAMALVIALAVGALRLSPRRKSQVAFVALSLAASFYVVEAVLAVGLPLRAGVHARMRGAGYDFRTYREVVHDLRAAGIPAYPCLFPRALLDRADLALDELPLGSISRTMTVYCNESGEYLTYRSDERGFHNPEGAWAGPLEIAIVGDSFAQGACVASGHSFAGLIQQTHPHILNIGMGGNGPLLSLAGIREYLADLEPRTVLWFFYEGNDLDDLRDEMASPLLRRYLADGDFQQGLAGKQEEIDAVLERFADEALDLEQELPGPLGQLAGRLNLPVTLARMARLSHLRGVVNQALDDPLGYSVSGQAEEARQLQEILEAADAAVRSWGGKLYFALLPGWDLTVQSSSRRAAGAGVALAAARQAGLETIDLTPALQGLPRPETAFYFPGSHYSDVGHRVVAEVVLERLDSARADGLR